MDDDTSGLSRRKFVQLSVNPASSDAFAKLLSAEAPDAHWPIDTHPDHQAASLLAIRAFVGAEFLPSILLSHGLRREGSATNVRSLAVLLAGLASLEFETVATLVTLGAAASVIPTTSVTVVLAPAASDPA